MRQKPLISAAKFTLRRIGADAEMGTVSLNIPAARRRDPAPEVAGKNWS